MSVRVTYEHELEVLKQDLKEMAHMVESAIEQTFMAFEDQDYTMAEDVIKGDRTVNDMERAIESRCLSLILRQQPVACDLRVISTALKIVPDMERIGDQAVDISELMPSIAGFEFAGRVHIKEMAGATVKMVTESVQAFVDSDEMLAEKVIASDDLVDQLFDKVKEELVELICQKSIDVVIALDLLMTAKYFERIGDHAVNIAENVRDFAAE